MKKKLNLKIGCWFAFVCFILCGVLFYAIARVQLCYRENQTQSVSATENVGEIISGMEIRQQFIPDDDMITAIDLQFLTSNRKNTGSLTVELLDGEKNLMERQIDVSKLKNGKFYSIPMHPKLRGVGGHLLTLRVTSQNGSNGNAVSLLYGNSMSTGHGEIPIKPQFPVTINGTSKDGQLCIIVSTERILWFGTYYWYLLFAAVAAFGIYLLHLANFQKKGKSCFGLRVISAFVRYHFLIGQLVLRDFKTKYKRSMLGMFWSFLNPLLMMLVQYVVFSTLFKTDIPNYPLYLLTGIVCFNFFSESVNLSMTSITGNASLITKVYVPKYIYPLSRTLSSGINLLLSMIPLLLAMIVTGQHPTPALLLLPIGIVFLFSFCFGMGLLLSTLMVFFNDTQFLWGVLVLAWMYATPIFYPENILPDKWIMIFKMNPMYHVIRFFRSLILDGVSPEPKAYLFCFLATAAPLLIGAIVFKKNQDKFVLYI